MSIKPILFSTPMVQAILDGRKSMTRRVIVPQPQRDYHIDACKNGTFFIDDNTHMGTDMQFKPKYQPGDILWVRETWAQASQNRIVLRADYADEKAMIPYEACGMNVEVSLVRWRPSIFMPREACRLFLRVTGVQAERLQDITATDAVHEGIARHGMHNAECYAGGCYNGDFETACAVCEVPREGFRELWDSLNAKRGYGWEKNPWVWVYTFKRCDRPQGWPNGEG